MRRFDRESIDPASLVLAGANPSLLSGQFPNLEIVPHVRIQIQGRAVEYVGGRLQDERSVVGVDPVNLDATAGFVHDVDVTVP